MNKSCDYHGAAHDEHLNCYESTGAAKRPEECTAGAEPTNEIFSSELENMVGFQVLPDTFTNEYQQRNSCRLRIPWPLSLLPKIQKKAAGGGASPFRNSYQAFLLSKEMLVTGCVKLAGAIRRRAVVCLAPSSGGADEDDLPYSQLDKVTHALRKEAFGPLYLVT